MRPQALSIFEAIDRVLSLRQCNPDEASSYLPKTLPFHDFPILLSKINAKITRSKSRIL